jgi:hypothetical protein
VSTPKNNLARVIDLDSATVNQIRFHRQRQLSELEAWGDDYRDGDLAFCKENGESIHPQTLSQAFERLVDKSDLPRIRLHGYADLRVMPTSARDPLRGAGSGLLMSA